MDGGGDRGNRRITMEMEGHKEQGAWGMEDWGWGGRLFEIPHFYAYFANLI